MYLNYDCMRDTLIALADNLNIHQDSNGNIDFCGMYLTDLTALDDLMGYRAEDVYYSLYNLYQAGYIHIVLDDSEIFNANSMISDITFAGHMFLRNIENITIWNLLKKRFGPALNVSLSVLTEAASQLLLRSLGPRG